MELLGAVVVVVLAPVELLGAAVVVVLPLVELQLLDKVMMELAAVVV